jgi:hypothetical protein
MLIVFWMTRSITDHTPGWGAHFNGRVGDGSVTVSISLCIIINGDYQIVLAFSLGYLILVLFNFSSSIIIRI